MLSERQLLQVIYEINTLGFSVVENVIDADLQASMRSALIKAIEEDDTKWKGFHGKRYDLINSMIDYRGDFLNLLANETMHQVFSAVISPTCVLYNYSSTFLLPNGKPGAANLHVDTPRHVPGYNHGLIMTLALDDFTEDNGATYYLPGSQNLPEPPPELVFERYAVSVARPAGAAVFFNPRCYHKAMHNSTHENRCGVTVYATRSFMKPRFDFPKMISDEELAELPPKIRQFLGFDVRIPADLSEFYVPEEQRLYKSGQG